MTRTLGGAAMISKRLSRSTLPAFACALVNFVAAQGLILAGVTWPARTISAPGTLIVVHLLVIGWLSLLMLGALFQFVPVITCRPLPSQPLAFATVAILEAGLAGMVCGFIGFGGGSRELAIALPSGGAVVIVGVLLGCWNIGVPLIRSRPLPLPGRMILSGLIFLILTVTLGLSFALALTVAPLTPNLAPLMSSVGDHAIAGLGGWFTLTAMGVGYKLFPMFMLAPEERGITGECVHVLGAAGFALAIGAGVARIWLTAEPLRIAQWTGYVAIGLAVTLYLWDIVRIYRTRRRALIEAHNRAVSGAFGFLGIATMLAAVFLATGHPDVGSPLVVFLLIFGWLTGLALTQLYKIVPFLTWLSRYGSHLGRGGVVPRVQDLVRERRGRRWFALYFLGVLLGAVSVLLRSGLAFRFDFALVTISTLGLITEYWRAWRGHYARPPNSRPDAPPFLPDPRGSP